MTGHICDSMKASAGRIQGNIKRTSNIGIDETTDIASKRIWTCIIQASNNITIIYNKSYGSPIHDIHLDKYRVVTSDYSIYERFDIDGKHQLYRVHKLRQLQYAAQKKDAPLSVKILH